MEPVSAALGAAVSTAKEALSLKLETPFMLVASLIGWLSMLSIGSRDQDPFHTPLEAVSKFFSWLGWMSASTWSNNLRDWIVDPARHEALHGLFFMLALSGVAFAAFGTRLAFSAMIGVGGLVEIGSTTAAWVVPSLALVSSVLVGRVLQLRQPDPWASATKPCIQLLVAWLYFPLAVVALIVGERNRSDWPQPVELELSRETRDYIDKRLTAFGMPSLNPPVSGFPPIVDLERLRQVYPQSASAQT